MMEMLVGLICFVTGTVSFLYATRVAWACGKKCTFSEEPEVKKQNLRVSLPIATGLYLCGFLIVFSNLLDGFITIYTYSIMSAILASHLVVSMSMPELKRRPNADFQGRTEEAKSIRV